MPVVDAVLVTLPAQALSFCGRQYVSPSAAAAETPRADAKPQGAGDDDASDSDGEEAAAAAAPAPYVSAMRRTEAAAANRAQVRALLEQVTDGSAPLLAACESKRGSSLARPPLLR